MTDAAILKKLREEALQRPPAEIAELLGELTTGRLTHSVVISYFKRAFPEIPLRTLIDAGEWSRVGGNMNDQGFNDLLRPWLSPERRKEEESRTSGYRQCGSSSP
jgi:hypothetical protein